jgi:hypothetical protein
MTESAIGSHPTHLIIEANDHRGQLNVLGTIVGWQRTPSAKCSGGSPAFVTLRLGGARDELLQDLSLLTPARHVGATENARHCYEVLAFKLMFGDIRLPIRRSARSRTKSRHAPIHCL